MTQDDIIRMAEEAGAIHYWHLSNLERFAALVAAAEREACAELCEQMDHDGVMIAADCAEAIRARGNK